MPKHKPLKYRDVATILKNLGFKQESGTGSSHLMLSRLPSMAAIENSKEELWIQ